MGMNCYQKKDKTERARGLGGKMTWEIGKRDQMKALRFQTGDTSDIPGLLSRGREFGHESAFQIQSLSHYI